MYDDTDVIPREGVVWHIYSDKLEYFTEHQLSISSQGATGFPAMLTKLMQYRFPFLSGRL